MSVEAYIDVSLEESKDATREEILEALFKIAERLNTAVRSWPYDSYWVQPTGDAVVGEYEQEKSWEPKLICYRRVPVPYTYRVFEWRRLKAGK